MLFVDADVTLDQHAARTAVFEGQQKQVEVVTLFLRTAPEGFWPQVVMPYMGNLLLTWFDPLRVNNPKLPTGFVNGQFLLIRSDAYHRIDGHRAVRHFIIEDIPFGQHAKTNGVTLRVGAGSRVGQVRMYSDLVQIVSGFSRIFIGGLRSRVKLILTAGILLSALLPFVAAPLLANAWLAGFGDGGWLTQTEFAVLSGLGLMQLTSSTIFNARIWATGGLSLKWIVFYPLALVVALYTMA